MNVSFSFSHDYGEGEKTESAYSAVWQQQTGMSITDRAAGPIASMSVYDNNTDVADSMVALREGELQVKLSANVIKVGDQILGTLIDIRV